MLKEPHEWTEDDLLRFISNKAQESLTLDFKGCGALTNKSWKHDFVKDVSAFANSAGGVLIYGLKESEDTHEAQEIDLGFDPTEPSKEQLEQIVNSRIHRRIEGVRYNAVSLNHSRPGRVAYVISVPESSHAPHMADHRFYRRFEFESVPMEEFEVRERYRRETYPSRDIVRAWFDDGMNPLLDSLASEQRTLGDDRWTWNHFYKSFGGLNPNQSTPLNRSANQDQFLERYPVVKNGLAQHDTALVGLNKAATVLFNEVWKRPILKNLFKRATSRTALKALKAEHPHQLTGNTKKQLYGQVFGNQPVNNTLAWLAEYSINQLQMLQNNSMMPFWEKHRDEFFEIPLRRPFAAKRRTVVNARIELSAINEALIGSLEQIRRTLSEKHGVPIEETRRTVYEPYSSGLGGLYR